MTYALILLLLIAVNDPVIARMLLIAVGVYSIIWIGAWLYCLVNSGVRVVE